MANADAVRWSEPFARLAWRLTPSAAVNDFKARALSSSLSLEGGKAAMVALGFISTQESADAMVEIAKVSGGRSRRMRFGGS